jgi:hypothetical protein
MSFKLQAAMASGLRSDETKPRRFDLNMSRRTRRPPAATLATSCYEQDRHQAVDVEGLGFQPVVVQPEPPDPDGLFCLSDHLQSRQPELVAQQEHETSEQRSEDTTQEQTCRLEKKDDESEAQQQKEEEEECQDNSRRFSLQELIEDEAVDGVKEENAAAAVRDVAEGAAAAEKQPEQVPGRRVIGIMRRYVKVRSIEPKRASPEKKAAAVC